MRKQQEDAAQARAELAAEAGLSILQYCFREQLIQRGWLQKADATGHFLIDSTLQVKMMSEEGAPLGRSMHYDHNAETLCVRAEGAEEDKTVAL